MCENDLFLTLERLSMRSLLLVIALLLVLPLSTFAQGTKKYSIPSKEAQGEIEKLLSELYKDELAKAAKDPIVRARFAQTLLHEGRETKDDAAGRYVLFTKAHQFAAEAGDVNTALMAADELANGFLIPPASIFQMKIKMLEKASAVKDASPDAYQSVIDRALVTLDETLEADDYPSSLALIGAAEKAAIRLRSIALVSSIRKRQDEIVRLQKEFARWQPFVDRLGKNPKDAEANFELGKYHALVKGDWERGLPMLALHDTSALKKLAESDLARPTDAGDRRIVALGWYTFGTDKKTDPSMRGQALLRAYHWYQQNLATADDKDRALIQQKLQDINELLPAEYRIGEIRSELRRIDLPSGPVYGCDFSPDGKRILATGYDGLLRLMTAKTGKSIRELPGHSSKVWTVAFMSDGRHAVSGGFDNVVRLWDVNTGRPVKLFEGHKDYVRSVATCDDPNLILSAGDDRTMRLWNVKAGKESRIMGGHDHTIWCVALSRDGKRALSASLDKTVRFWDVEKGETIKKLQGHTDTVLAVAFMPDGRHAVTGSSDKTLRLWDLNTGSTVQTFEGSTGYIQSVAVSPDGRRILSAGADNMVRLWDVQTGKMLRQLDGHRDQVWHVAFSRDGRFALSSGQDGTIRIWTGGR